MNVVLLQHPREIMLYTYSNPNSNPLYYIFLSRSFHLAFGDVQTNWTWVVVLEECQASSRSSRKLIRDSLPSWTREGSGNSPRPWSDTLDTEVSLDASLGGVGGGFASDPAQLLEVNSAIA
jgi:hypothetical protein